VKINLCKTVERKSKRKDSTQERKKKSGERMHLNSGLPK
jgi:hypothetical protein